MHVPEVTMPTEIFNFAGRSKLGTYAIDVNSLPPELGGRKRTIEDLHTDDRQAPFRLLRRLNRLQDLPPVQSQ